MTAHTTHITDSQDTRLDHYRSIRDRDLAGRGGLFVAEGKVVLRTLLQAGRFELVSVLLLENRVAGMAEILRALPEDVPVYVTDARTLEAVAGYDVHRGVLAIGRRAQEDPGGAISAAGGPSLCVAMVALTNHDNVGAVFRNAAAFGADAVFMDEQCCDPLYRKAIRVSVGAALSVPFARFASADAMCEALADAGYSLYALTPAASTELGDLVPASRSALLLGTEGEGLPRNILERCIQVRIAMAEGFDSLNVATAGAIALHHFRQRMTGGG